MGWTQVLELNYNDMNKTNTLLIRKGDDGAVKNTFTQWGICCAKVPFKAGGETKDVPSRNFPDEDGEYSFIPKSLKMKAYNAEFEFVYSGEELAQNIMNLSHALTQIEAFKAWLTGNDDPTNYPDGTGAELTIYSPYSNIGRKGCYLVSFSDEEPCVIAKGRGSTLYNENVVTFKGTFRVTDPVTQVTLSE